MKLKDASLLINMYVHIKNKAAYKYAIIFRFLLSFEFRMYIFGEDRTIMADQG